jgi:hypothetical protein
MPFPSYHVMNLTLPSLALASLLVLGGCRSDSNEMPQASAQPDPDNGLRVTTDPHTVFRRAFWAHPAADDQILAAELREWIDPATGTTSAWQWFIHLQPGAALASTLSPGGRFELLPVAAAAAAQDFHPSPPNWFSPHPVSPGQQAILRSANGGLTVFPRPEDGTFFASDEGGGFTAPASP